MKDLTDASFLANLMLVLHAIILFVSVVVLAVAVKILFFLHMFFIELGKQIKQHDITNTN